MSHSILILDNNLIYTIELLLLAMKSRIKIIFTLSTMLVLILIHSGCLESESPPSLGDFAKSYLQGGKYKRIIIEIDYVEGHRPSAQAQDILRPNFNR